MNTRNGGAEVVVDHVSRSFEDGSISALVDVTNYVTFDLCRPLHVFDAKKLEGDLTMRFARPGECVQALDGKTYQLDETMTVIADNKQVQGIGGVMGGADAARARTRSRSTWAATRWPISRMRQVAPTTSAHGIRPRWRSVIARHSSSATAPSTGSRLLSSPTLAAWNHTNGPGGRRQPGHRSEGG